jgi:hypothetical protein
MEARSNDTKLIGVEATWVHAEKEKKIQISLDLNSYHDEVNKVFERKIKPMTGSSEV